MSRIHAEDDKTIKDLLESSALIFRIPINQRKFSWEEEQLIMFLNDLKSIIKNKSRHYLGAFSFIIKDNEDSNFNCYEIIDGQQRLTTIILLLSALRDVYYSLNNIQKAIKIQETYLSSISTRKCLNKLEVSKLDEFTFSKIVNINIGDGTNIELSKCSEIECKKNKYRILYDDKNNFINNKMYNAYKFFYNEIVSELCGKNENEKKDYLLDIEESLSRLDIILIKSDDIESMFLFFESLNNRGLQLSKMDIIRNGLLKIISKKYPKDLEKFGQLWDELIIILDGFDQMKFLKYYYMCTKENKIIQSNELPRYYEKYFNSFSNKNELISEIEKMKRYSEIYIRLFTKEEVTTSDEDYIRNIKLINQLGQQACHSFLMEYMYYVKDNERLNNISDLIEKMMFKRIICSRSTKQLDGIFRDLIKVRVLNNKKNIYEFDDLKIKEIIISNTPSEIEYSNILKERRWESNDITNYFLRKIEYKLLGKSLSKQFVIRNRKEVHIEHILPQNFKSDWAKKFNLENDKSLYDILSSKIGNLILLEFNINTSIKDSEFNVKVSKYKESTLEQVKSLINNYGDWNEEAIRKRTEQLVDLAINIWKY